MIFIFLRKNNLRNLQKIIFITAFCLGTVTLIISYSRAAWIVFAIGFLTANFLIKNKKWHFRVFITLFIFSIVMPIVIGQNSRLVKGSLFERSELISTSLTILAKSPLTGVGLNNSLDLQYKLMPKNFGMFVFQPVHNGYLLLSEELGLIGLLFFLIFLYKQFEKMNKKNIEKFLPFFSVLLLSFFDHYIFTLQQGYLMFAFFAGLVFLEQK